MRIEYPTKKGSIYSEDNGEWYHSKGGKEIKLERGLKVPSSVLEDVLMDYNLEKGDIVPEDKKEELFKDLKQEGGVTKFGNQKYRICFLNKSRICYSSYLSNSDKNFSLGDVELKDSDNSKDEYKIEA